MKILYHHRIASKDGQYVHVEELTKALKKQGHEIIMVCPNVTENKGFGSKGGMVPVLKRFIPGFIYEVMEIVYALYAYTKLRKSVKQHNPDCLYERYNLFTPAGVWLKRRFNLPMLLEVNAPIFQERSKYDGIAIPWLAQWSEQYTWKGADVALPVTEVLAGYVRKAGVEKDHIVVIPNGIDLEKFREAPNTKQPDVVEYASPLKLFEYLALGRAIIAPDTDNIKEILTHEKNAILFNPEDENDFTPCIDKLCSNNQMRENFGKSAEQTIYSMGLTWENNAKRVEKLLSGLDVSNIKQG